MTKDEWIQKAKAYLFDMTNCLNSPLLSKEAQDLIDEAGGYNYKTEDSKSPLNWPD